MEKTILVVISKVVMRRNILETDFWPNFLEENKDNRIVLIGEAGESDRYREKYSGPNIVHYEVKKEAVGFWHKIVLFMVRTGTNAHGVRLYRWRGYTNGEASLLLTLFKSLISQTVGRVSWYHRFVRKLYLGLTLRWVDAIYDEHKPDLVFVPSLIDINVDAIIGATGKSRGIQVVGMVRSWDNMAIHGLLPFVPDTFIFQNQYLKECAENIQSIDLSKIQTHIIGLPHYDSYRFPESYLQSREDFMKSNGYDPDKKLILLGGFDFYWSEDVLPGKLDAAIESGRLESPTQVVFRPHPRTPFKIEDYHMGDLKHTTLNAPFLDKSTAFSDEHFFINLVYHCDVLINVASTLAIDGAVFDKPVICINYDDPDKVLPKWKKVERLFDSFDHYEALMETGCAKISYSFDEMIADINSYYDDPSLHHENRRAAVERFVSPFEGDSSKRLARIVTDEISQV